MTDLRTRNNQSSKKSYEKSLEHKFATDYEYEVVKQHSLRPNTKVWHWSSVPEDLLFDCGYIQDFAKHRYLRLMRKKEEVDGMNRVRDYGFDGLAQVVSLSGIYFESIQAKYYLSKKVTANDIGTFFVKQQLLSLKNQLSKGYLYTTTKLQTDFAEAVQHPDYPIRHILHPWKHPDDRKSSEKEKIKDILSIPECELPLRDYQKEALDELQDYDEGILALHIPCGLGKTLIAGHFLKYCNKNFIIMIAPLKVSVENLYDRLSCFFPDYDSLIVDSDSNGTTDEKEINEFIIQKQKKIIYSTYKSSIEILSEMKLDLSDAIVLGDEIHRANTELCQFIKQFSIGLVMSATLPEEIENELDISHIVYIPFSRGIQDNYLVDYTIWLPHLIHHPDKTTSIDIIIPIELSDYNKDLTAKALFNANCMLKTGSRRCIVYLANQEECEQYMSIAKEVFETYHGCHLWINKVDSTVSKENRKKRLQEFQEGADDIFHIMTSVYILDEAVDIPECDSEFITMIGEKSSNIRMMQRSQRGSRIDKKRPHKHNHIFIWADGWEKCVNSLELLRNSDPDYHTKIRIVDSNYDQSSVIERKEDITKESIEFTKWQEVQSMTFIEKWKNRLEEVKKYINEYEKRPSNTSKDYITKLLGNWLCRQASQYKKKTKCMKYDIIRLLWQEFIMSDTYSKYFLSNEEEWKNILEEIKKYIDENKKRPSSEDKNNSIKQMGRWILCQVKNYKNKEQIMKDDTIYSLWKHFINDDKYKNYFMLDDDIWKNTLERVKKYMDEHQKRPSNSDKNPSIKSLGMWLVSQSKNYKKKIHSMKNDTIYSLWQDFITSDTYSKYFVSNKEEWINNLDKVINYINEYNTLPTGCHKNKKIKTLGLWIRTQKKNYIEKINIMQNDKIYSLWNQFIMNDNYSKYFISNKEEWKNNIEKVKKYIDKHKKLPSNSSKNPDTLGEWISSQKQNYKNKENIMKDDMIYSLWEDFITSDTYSKYFISNEEHWKTILEEVKKYIDENKKRPSSEDKDIYITQLGRWILCQVKNYKNKEQIMKDDTIYSLWEEFITSNTYSKYFISNEEHWKTTLEEVKKYIDENKKRPLQTDKNIIIKQLGKWISHQVTNYKNKKNIMKDETIYSLWEEFIKNDTYSKYFT